MNDMSTLKLLLWSPLLLYLCKEIREITSAAQSETIACLHLLISTCETSTHLTKGGHSQTLICSLKQQEF